MKDPEQGVRRRTHDSSESEQRYRTLFDTSPIAQLELDFSDVMGFLRELRISLTDEFREHLRTRPELAIAALVKTKVLAANRRAHELFEIAEDPPPLDEILAVLSMQSPECLCTLVVRLLDEHSSFEVDVENQDRAGRRRYLRQRVTAIPGGEDGWSRAVVSMLDITADRESELRLLEDAKRRELLLREIHHRIKNNLTVVSSLFYLQADTAKDEQSARSFVETQRRVRSMALVHEMLYQSIEVSAIDFGEYAQVLATELFAAVRPGDGVRLRTDVDRLNLELDVAVPCGLILNELISNALKHAFPGDRAGDVVVTIGRAEDGSGLIQVADDGVGLPERLPTGPSDSLGIRLVSR